MIHDSQPTNSGISNGRKPNSGPRHTLWDSNSSPQIRDWFLKRYGWWRKRSIGLTMRR